ncbi:MAG TPA: CarD family transcriptional regulator, partial [Candidatus Binatia bacterium]|nr:CarD family transcriptional regulator [Candidatus Binatia bacterium]
MTATRVRPAASRGGADRRLTVLTDTLVPYLPPARGALRVPANARAAHLAARREAVPASTPLVAIVRTEDEAHRLADDLGAWLTGGSVRVLPERAALPLERALPEHDESAARLEVLAQLGGRSRGLVLIAPLLALVQRTLSPAQLAEGSVSLALGDRIAQRALLTALVSGGYDAAVEVSGVGEFASRGGIVDVWPPGAAEPVRIELFGDEVESIRSFDPMTQGSRRRLERATLLPASEFLPPGGWASLVAAAPQQSSEVLEADRARLEQGDLAEAAETWAWLLTAAPAADHLPESAHLILTDADELRAIARELDLQAVTRRAGLVEAGELPAEWPLPYEARTTLAALEARATESLEEQAASDGGYATAPALPGRSERLGPWLTELAAAGHRIVVTTDQASRVGELLEESGLQVAPAAELREAPLPGAIGLVHGTLSAGFAHAPSSLLVISDRELFGAIRVRRLTPAKRVVTRDLIGKLAAGDLVVHVDHGIARYAGMAQRTLLDTVREYLQLDFAGDDKIFLPADQVGRITRYSGSP